MERSFEKLSALVCFTAAKELVYFIFLPCSKLSPYFTYSNRFLRVGGSERGRERKRATFLRWL